MSEFDGKQDTSRPAIAPDLLLPRRFALPFGEGAVEVQNQFGSYLDAIATVMTGLKDLGQADKQRGPFFSKAATVKIKDLTLTASSGTPLFFRLDDSKATTLTIPFAGLIRSTVDGTQHLLQPGQNGIFLGGKAMHGESDTRSALMLKLTPERLLQTAMVMLGRDQGVAELLNLQQSRPVSLTAGNFSFDLVFRKYCEIVDQFQEKTDALELLNLDDAIYRTTVMVMMPDLFFGIDESKNNSRHAQIINRLCEFLRANIDRPVGLTDMERHTNLSTRTLSRIFQKEMGCSPMAWVHEQRLSLIHQALKKAKPHETVTSISSDLGVTRLGAFSASYFQRFGELPSATLSNFRKSK
jgi:AraC-like DNA-binding protein